MLPLVKTLYAPPSKWLFKFSRDKTLQKLMSMRVTMASENSIIRVTKAEVYWV